MAMKFSKRTAVVCPQCGASLAPGATECQYCGSQFGTVSDQGPTKFCKYCGQKIPMDAVVCTKCGRQVEELRTSSSPSSGGMNMNVNIQNSAPLAGNRSFVPYKKPLSKWTAFFLCLFFGWLGAHKFYEGKNGMGVLYLFTFGLLGIGIVIDLISLFFKPHTYYI